MCTVYDDELKHSLAARVFSPFSFFPSRHWRILSLYLYLLIIFLQSNVLFSFSIFFLISIIHKDITVSESVCISISLFLFPKKSYGCVCSVVFYIYYHFLHARYPGEGLPGEHLPFFRLILKNKRCVHSTTIFVFNFCQEFKNNDWEITKNLYTD